MEELSLRLHELLELILDPNFADEARMHYENSLKKLISREPRAKNGLKTYPKDYLSQILIDNYTLFLKISTLYFNLSFLSLVTRYLVSLIYNLECWEIYHLLHVIPDFEYILKLLDFDVKYTSFGHVVKPPANYLNFNLRQGLQYPFPYPFYNFSYHAVNPEAAAKKLLRVSIKPYIDLRLDKLVREELADVPIRQVQPEMPETTYASDSDHLSADSEDFRRWKIVYMFVDMTPERIQHDFDLCFITPAQRAYEDDEYDLDRAQLIEAKEQENVEECMPGLRMTLSVFQKAFSKAYDNGLVKHSFLHQCKLMDPASHKTCLKVFYGKNELHRHQEFVHATKKRLYRCAYCLKDDNDESKKCYPRYDSLARHIRRKHGIVGRENKHAIMLARNVAETEEIFGGLPNLLFEPNVETSEERAGLRASLASDIGVTRPAERTPSESNIQHNIQRQPSILEKAQGTSKRRNSAETQKKPKKARTAAAHGSNIPYNEFRTGRADEPDSQAPQPSTNTWPSQSVNLFEYQPPEPDRSAQVGDPTSDTTQYLQAYNPYSAYSQGYGAPYYPAPESSVVYGHSMAMGVHPQSPPYPYMGQMYPSSYAQPQPNNPGGYSPTNTERRFSQESGTGQASGPQSHMQQQRQRDDM